MKHTLLKAISFAALTTASINASAYTTWECLGQKEKWTAETTTLRLSGVSFAPGAWRDAMTTAITRWNQNPSEFRFGISYNDASVGVDNGQSEAWFSNDAGLLDGSPAVAFIQMDCIDYWIFGTDVEITEADIVFDASESYTASTSKTNLWGYGGAYRPFQTTALHELGHALGLAHTNNTYNIMGEDWTHTHANGSTTRAYSGEDGNNGAVSLYGLFGGALEDLAVTHWKYSGADGEYSEHVRTRVLMWRGIRWRPTPTTARSAITSTKGKRCAWNSPMRTTGRIPRLPQSATTSRRTISSQQVIHGWAMAR